MSKPRVSRWEISSLAAILLAYVTVLGTLAGRVGVTVDEPSHLLSAHLYWQGQDRLAPRDMPPLIKIVGGWVPGRFHIPIPYDNQKIMASGHEWPISGEMMMRMDEAEIQQVFFYSRLPFLLFPVLTACLVWWWGRELFSPAVGVLLALLYTLEPTAMGHGALFKNDIAATFTYLFFWHRAWVLWRNPALRNAAWFGFALLAAILSKMSLLILAGIAPVIVLARYLTLRPKSWRPLAAALALVLLIPYAGALSAYQFEAKRLTRGELASYSKDGRVPQLLLCAARVFRIVPVPAPLWQGGVSLVQSNADEATVYLLGHKYPQGSRLYFLTALAVKIPVPMQILLLAGLLVVVATVTRRRFPASHLFWILPAVLYIGLASLSKLQLGVRLVLPALPFGLLLCGMGVQWCLRGRQVLILGTLLVWLVVADARIYPHFISFFNLWAGGPDNGICYLSDSNLDWGQDLGELARLIRQRGIKNIRVSYFGNDNIYAHFRADELEVIPPPWDDKLARGKVLRPSSGYYAISATLLTGQFLPEKYVHYYDAFRTLRPIAKAGYSIFIYRVE